MALKHKNQYTFKKNGAPATTKAAKDFVLATPASMEKVAEMRKSRKAQKLKEEEKGSSFITLLENAKTNLSKAQKAVSKFEVGTNERRCLFVLITFYRAIIDGKIKFPIHQLNDISIDLEKGTITVISVKDRILVIADLLKTNEVKTDMILDSTNP